MGQSKLTVQSILRALEKHGIGRGKLEKLVEAEQRVDPRLTKADVKDVERMLRKHGKCAVWVAKNGKVYFVHEGQITSGWKFKQRGGARPSKDSRGKFTGKIAGTSVNIGSAVGASA